MELMVDVHFLATNGLSMNKGDALNSLIDFQLSFHNNQIMKSQLLVLLLVVVIIFSCQKLIEVHT